MSITWRPARVDDAAAITEVVRASRALAGAHDLPSEQMLREELAGPFWDLATDTLVAEDDQQLVAFGGVIAPSQDGTTVRAQASVHPDHRGQGLGTHLLAALVNRARAMRAAAGATEPWTLRHGSDDRNPSAAELLTAHGLAPVRFWYEMERDLENVVAPQTIEGLELRAVRTDDTEAVYDAHRAAFVDHWGSQNRGFDSFVSRVAGSSAFRPELSRIAVDGTGVVAGYALVFVEADPTMITFALIGTRREWRGRGIASELVRRSLTAAREAGLSSAALLVDGESPTGAVGVYEKLGFRTIGRSTTYAIDLS